MFIYILSLTDTLSCFDPVAANSAQLACAEEKKVPRTHRGGGARTHLSPRTRWWRAGSSPRAAALDLGRAERLRHSEEGSSGWKVRGGRREHLHHPQSRGRVRPAGRMERPELHGLRARAVSSPSVCLCVRACARARVAVAFCCNTAAGAEG